MKPLSDAVLAHLRHVTDWPEPEGTRYRIIERLASGGMGTIYLAEDLNLGREVAFKVLNDLDSSPEASERMLREARIIARLEHPGIVPVHEVGRLADSRIFYVMKLVRGSRLDQYLAADRSLSERLGIFERICEAVAFAHAHGVIHRDLKPENVMVGPFGEVLVMDWGTARVLREPQASQGSPLPVLTRPPANSRLTLHGTVIGTPAYMAPEQVQGRVEEVDERSDVYALGAILAFLLAGRAPGEGTPSALTSGARTPLQHASGERETSLRRPEASIPRRLEAIYLKAMQAERSERYPSVKQLADDVASFRAGLAVSAYQEGLLERTARIAAKYRVALLLIVAYLVMRMALLLFLGR